VKKSKSVLPTASEESERPNAGMGTADPDEAGFAVLEVDVVVDVVQQGAQEIGVAGSGLRQT